ncbi:MAG: hypothetical protein LUF30_04345 [Lachnospiraceae bacterium]|nr:hypothetical protein [Lachnospiraceae bacterium]
MGHEIEFERCIDFMAQMIEKYGHELLEELEMERMDREAEEKEKNVNGNSV